MTRFTNALPVICSLLVPAILTAQPTMNQSDAPQVDNVFPYVTGSYAPITTGGADVLWDLSGIGTSAVTNLPVESPGATAFGDIYPTATLAMDGGSTITYMRDDSTGLYLVGIYKLIAQQNIQIHYTDEQLFLPYPCTYNTAFTDTYAYNYSFTGQSGIEVAQGTGNSSYLADGFGTLVLPYDTIYNVLKLTGVDTVSESVPGTSYVTAIQQVYFYKPGVHYYVLNSQALSQSVNGGPPATGFGLFYLDQSAFSGIHEDLEQAIGVDAWPNPAQDILNVAYGVAGGHQIELDLFDATGRTVRTLHTTTGTSGIQRTELDVKGLPAGIYLLQVSDDHGQRGTRRVVIQ
ncbi:MAG: T9SS type A sorting domain-containing protein [Flavobacteriales bacterium]